MTTTRVILLLGVLIIAGCKPGQQVVLRHEAEIELPLIRQELQAIVHLHQLAGQSAEAGQVGRAQGYADEVTARAVRLNTRTQHFFEPPEQLQADFAILLRQIREDAVQAELIKEQTNRNVAIYTAKNRINAEPGPLEDTDTEALNGFLRDFVCLHLEKLINKQELPSDDDYQAFLIDRSLEEVLPLWKLKEQADGVIEFANGISEPQSPAEVQARLRLWKECSFQ